MMDTLYSVLWLPSMGSMGQFYINKKLYRETSNTKSGFNSPIKSSVICISWSLFQFKEMMWDPLASAGFY